MLERNDVRKAVSDLLFKILNEEITDQILKTQYIDLGVDSLQIVCLYCELESILGIDLKLDEINLFELKTPIDTISFIHSRREDI